MTSTFTSPMLRRVRGNLPGRKPQLWTHLGFAVARRARQWWQTRRDPTWPDRSHVVGLSEFDLVMEVKPRNYYIDGFIYTFGVYEISGTRFFQAFLEPGMAVVDVGANAGYYSLVASRLVGPSGQVHAFEPVPRIRAKLQRNLALNDASNVRVYPAAVGAHVGELSLYVSEYDRNEGIASIKPGFGLSQVPETVPALTLDKFAEETGTRPSLIKLDIEGGEEDALRGAGRVLESDSRPAIFFESLQPERIFPLLRAHGYDVRTVHYSLRAGLEFYRVGERFDHVFAGYEGINHVALCPNRHPSFETLVERSRNRIPPWLRLLGRIG